MKRNRIIYGFLIIMVMTLGLTSRRFGNLLPKFVYDYIGDILWALMIFLGFGVILPKYQTKKVAIMALIFCYFIEISQLYQGEWINIIRHTTLGGLILGYGFLWTDLISYTVGIGSGVIMEKLYILK